MKRLQAYRYELRPNGDQERRMRRFSGCCRFVFNKALSLQKERYERGEKKLGYAGLCRLLTKWRHGGDTAWLADAPVHPLQQSLKDLERAYANFFAKRAGFPRFKKKGKEEGFRYPDPVQVKLDQANGRIFLPKLGWLRYRNSRKALGTVRNVTVSLSGGKWHFSVQTEQEVEEPQHPSDKMVGIDLGVVRFATLSDGTVIEPLGSLNKHRERLCRYQRALSRKQKFSNNWKKAKAKVQRLHASIADARRDYLHKSTTTISKNHAIVFIEDLQVRNMSKSAAGSREDPGQNVRAKSALNRAILDQGWFEFRRQVEYKQAWRGGLVIAVPPGNTSRTCPACRQASAGSRLTQARFVCVSCGFAENADLVGAINVLAAGHAVIACGEPVQSGRSMKQEPTDATQAIFA